MQVLPEVASATPVVSTQQHTVNFVNKTKCQDCCCKQDCIWAGLLSVASFLLFARFPFEIFCMCNNTTVFGQDIIANCWYNTKAGKTMAVPEFK